MKFSTTIATTTLLAFTLTQTAEAMNMLDGCRIEGDMAFYYATETKGRESACQAAVTKALNSINFKNIKPDENKELYISSQANICAFISFVMKRGASPAEIKMKTINECMGNVKAQYYTDLDTSVNIWLQANGYQ